MDTLEEPIHVIIRLPYSRPEGFLDSQPVLWTEEMERTLWQIVGQTKPSLVDWSAVSKQLGNVPVPFLIRHAAFLTHTQLQDLHRIGEEQHQQQQQQQVQETSTRPASRMVAPSTSPISQLSKDHSQSSEGRDSRMSARNDNGSAGGSNIGSNPNITSAQDGKSHNSPSLSSSISTFPSNARPQSMSSSASTIRPVNSSSPAPSIRNVNISQAAFDNMYNSGILPGRGTASQPRSTRGSQLITPSHDRRTSNAISPHTQPTSPRDEITLAEANRRIIEPAHPFHHATLSASMANLSHDSKVSSPKREASDPSNPPFQDNDHASSLSSASTPYSQSNSVSQIFEETSFFNQLSSNDSLSRGQQKAEQLKRDEVGTGGGFQQSPFVGHQGRFGLGFVHRDGVSSYHQDMDDDDDDEDADGDNTDKDDESSSQDESGPLSEQIKQLHLEDVLAFLPLGASASGVLQRPAEESLQRRNTAGEKMPFQLDDELADLGTRGLEEILEHDGGDEDEDHPGKGIRFMDQVTPSRTRGPVQTHISTKNIRTSPERSGSNSQKSSAHNSVGSSYSDLSDSSVTQSAMEDAYLSGFNNSKMSLFMHASTRN